MQKKFVFWLLAMFFVLGTETKAVALNQNPNLNLGNTNILDGVIPPSGLHLLNYMTYYTADDIETDQPFPPGDHEVSALVYAPQLIYIHDKKIFNQLRYGLSALLPMQKLGLDSDILQENDDIMGDLVIGPFVGRRCKISDNLDLHWFFEFDTYLPIGDYDKDKAINPSANYFSLEPFLSLTLLSKSGWELSTRQHFIHNFENSDYVYQGTEGDLQAGQMYHFNYSLTKNLPALDPNLRIGVVGYFAQQLDKDEFEGDDIDDSEEEVFSIGPGLVWIHKGMFLGFKAMFETHAEERPQGEKYMFQIRFKF